MVRLQSAVLCSPSYRYPEMVRYSVFMREAGVNYLNLPVDWVHGNRGVLDKDLFRTWLRIGASVDFERLGFGRCDPGCFVVAHVGVLIVGVSGYSRWIMVDQLQCDGLIVEISVIN